MRRLGAALGIRGPSLYKHVPNKAVIETAVTIDVLTELPRILEGVEPGFAAIAGAYRAWPWPTPTCTVPQRPLPREALPPGLEDRAAAPLLVAAGRDRALARAAINGLVDLELADRLPLDADIDAAYEAAARANSLAAAAPATG